MKILGIGLSGLVGSRVAELLAPKHTFENIGLETGIDITKKESISHVIQSSDSQIVLHLAAKVDVDGCEKDKDKGVNGDAWKINVIGTKYVVEACKKSQKKIIYFSTDFVFDGENPPEDGYSEEDTPNPINWYAKTKYEGEKMIQGSNLNWIIARLAYPYRAHFPRLDFVRTVIASLKKNQTLKMVTDHTITPTFIDDVASAIDALITNNAYGIYHLVGSEYVTPFDAGLKIADTFNLPKNLVKKTTRTQYFKNRATRPFKLTLKNDKIQKLGVKMKGFEEGLKEVKKQMHT